MTPASSPTPAGRAPATQPRTEVPAARTPTTPAPTPAPAPLHKPDSQPATAPSAAPPPIVPAAAPPPPAPATQPDAEPFVPRRRYADTDVLPLEEWDDYVTDMDVFYKFSDTQKKMAERVLEDCESQVKTLLEQEHRNLGPGTPLSSRTQTYVNNVFGDLKRRLNNFLRRGQQAMEPAAHARSTWRAPTAGRSASRSTGSVRPSRRNRTAGTGRTPRTTPTKRTNLSKRSSTPSVPPAGTSNKSGGRIRQRRSGRRSK